MKNICKFFFLALGVYTSAFSQITEITKLPVQDISQSIKESAPVWLSENEIIIFYVNQTMDTIFSTKSTNRGKSWGELNVIQTVQLIYPQEALYLSAMRNSTGRIFLAWSVLSESMKLIFSNDNGINWSNPINILGGGSPTVFTKSSYYLNLSEWGTGEICLSFYSNGASKSYYKLSFDNGVTWSLNPLDFPTSVPYKTKELSIISTGLNSLLAVYEQSADELGGIYSRISSDYGLNWSDPLAVIDKINHESRPKIAQLANGNIILAYQSDNVTEVTNIGQSDIYYKISEDKGLSWLPETRFTGYVGEDISLNISPFQNKTFVTFATERYSTIYPIHSPFQLIYGIFQESAETFTPPKVFYSSTPQDLIDFQNNQFVYRAMVIDDAALESVIVSMEDSAFVGEMFDDGLHNDEAANDSIFGNTFPFVSARYLNGYALDVNKIELPLNNAGVLADVNVTYGQRVMVYVSDPANNMSVYKSDINLGGGGSMGKYDGGGILYSAGFYLSGYVNGNLFANGVASSSLVEDYQPGKVSSSPDDPNNIIYVIRKSDPPFSYSWRKWKDAVMLGADFYDGDKDGIYNPVDKNWNETWDTFEDMPPLIGDEIVWCVYNDGVPADERRFGVEPIGIEVQQTLFASNSQELENVIFIKYKLTNTGLVSDVLDSIYFSPTDDTDIGDALDDLGGCDTLFQSSFTFNALDDQVYGNNPPAVYTTLLQGPVIQSQNPTDTAFIRNGEIIGEEIFSGYKSLGLYSFIGYAKSDPRQGDPQNVQHVWNYVHAKDRQGNMLNPCDTLYGKVYGNVDCNEVNPMFWFSGDPVSQFGWLDKRAMDDRKFSSIGPLTLEKNKPAEILLALVVGRGTNNLNSITVARENVQRAIQEYESNFASMTYTSPPAIPVTSYLLYQNYPNPFNPTTTIRYELPQDGVVTIEVFDILGQKVKTILNEFKDAGRYEVAFSSTGLASGVYIYQLRVDDFITSKKMMILR
jgi:hypothetical protein